MNNLNKNLKNRGFTILELMIVLGVAGLLLTIVFLAVPALSRNSKNSAYRQEAARILAGVNEWSTVNSGRTPGTNTAGAYDSTIAATHATQIAESSNLKDITSIDILEPLTEGETVPDFTTNKAVLRIKSKCNSAFSPSNKIASVGTGRQFALYYYIEGSSGDQDQMQCVSS